MKAQSSPPSHSFPASRWLVAIMGTLLQLCLGTVYAWSYFQKPLVSHYGWSNSQVAWAFSLAIGFLGLAAAWGGTQLPRFGPRRLAMIGAALFALGNLLAGLALAAGNLPLLLIGYGIIGGIGLGLGYVTPVATAAKWFPDKKGLVTGMVVMGFGFGALLMSKLLAPLLLSLVADDYATMFMLNSAVIAVFALPAAACLRNPPSDGRPPRESQGREAIDPFETDNGLPPVSSIQKSLMSSRFIRMWLIFFCIITAGIMFIGFQSPMLQDLLRLENPGLDAATLALAGATLIAVSSVCNGLGRLFWAALSDRIGRLTTFRLILASQFIVFVALTQISHPIIFAVLVCYILLCYGGGFGSMPAFVLDMFGKQQMPVIYGTILTAWSMGGIAGPQIVAIVRDLFPADQSAAVTFSIAAGLLLAGLIMAFSLKPTENQATTQIPSGG